jgi:nitrogenase molybdenum-iron protein beta chain
MNAPILPQLGENPRYTCSLGGGIATASAVDRVVPIIHAGPGCGMQLFNGLDYVAGYQGAGYVGGSATPSTNSYEREVVFGGEGKLRQVIQSAIEIMDAELYIVLTGCTSEIVGDDVRSVVDEFRSKGVSITYAETSGFKGLTRTGYERVVDSLVELLAEPAPRSSDLVNLFGVVPGADVFWRGNLEVMSRLLRQLGLRVNTFFTHHQGVESFRSSSGAALNVVLSPDLCQGLVQKYERTYGVRHLRFDGVPLGPSATSAFLRAVGDAMDVTKEVVEGVIRASMPDWRKW